MLSKARLTKLVHTLLKFLDHVFQDCFFMLQKVAESEGAGMDFVKVGRVKLGLIFCWF